MVRNILLKILLLPFALLFGIALSVKNLFYRTGMLRGVSFNIPVISIGNLTVGGAGKTPHTEYLADLLRGYLNVAILSRGYKRKTRGFLFVSPRHRADDVGDEPLQYKRKMGDVAVAVSESRATGIPRIIQEYPQVQVVLLDDAFQHRAVVPGLNILLTEYDHLYVRDFLLPSGRLREWPWAARRADIIVVTKCPDVLTRQDADQVITKLNPKTGQKVFFSKYAYQPIYPFYPGGALQQIDEQTAVLLICAIARTEYLLKYLHQKAGSVKMLDFEDHHDFGRYDMEMLKKYFENMEGGNKMILTTEKDAIRLEKHRQFFIENNLPVYVLPVKVTFFFENGTSFADAVKAFLLNFKV